MARLLDGKVAVITGAAAGIGRAAALIFAREGARLVLADVDVGGGEQTAEMVGKQRAELATEVAAGAGGQAIFQRADVAVRADAQAVVDAALAEYGRLDCAFNNAGVTGPMHPLVGYPEDEFDRVMAVNVKGTLHCMQAQIPAMLASAGGRGAIVNSSSGLGVVGAAALVGYVASKHAIMGITQVAALEYAQRGIRVNALLPGVIETNMPRALTAGAPEVLDALIAAMPVGRLGDPAEIAEAAAWLCSDRASLVTGHGMAVDGGYLTQ